MDKFVSTVSSFSCNTSILRHHPMVHRLVNQRVSKSTQRYFAIILFRQYTVCYNQPSRLFGLVSVIFFVTVYGGEMRLLFAFVFLYFWLKRLGPILHGEAEGT